jgi:hypothetical protein
MTNHFEDAGSDTRKCPLSGVKRTSRFKGVMSAFDPKRTDIFRHLFCAAVVPQVAWNRGSSRSNRNDMSKDTLDGRGPQKFCVAGTLSMTPRDQYLLPFLVLVRKGTVVTRKSSRYRGRGR